MSRLVRALLVVGTLLALGSARARAEFSFIHASDPHAGSPEHAAIDARMFKEIAQRDPKPAFVVVTGDIVDYGTDEEYERFRNAAGELNGIPAYLAPGNHDVRWNPLGKEGYTRGTSGRLYQSWDHGGVHFVTLDSTVLLEHWGHISQEQLDWLEKDLAKTGTEKPVIIGFHHWIGRPEGEIYVDNEQQLIDLTAPYNVVLWLQGHGHANVEWNVNGVPATMVGALYDGSYDLVTITDDGQLKIRKRTWKQPKRAAELLKQAGQAGGGPELQAQWRDLLSVPLKKQAIPKWDASAKFEGDQLHVIAQRGDLPGDADVQVRIDTEKWLPAQSRGDSWSAMFATQDLVPGVHVVTVRAILPPDQRAYTRPVRVEVPGQVQPIWQTDIRGAVQSKLVRDGELLYVTSMGNDLVALAASDGAEKFRVTTGGPVFSSPDVAEGVVYFGSADHFVYAADAKTGKVKWKTETGGAVLGGPGVTRGVVCIGSCDKKIYGLDASDGHVLWTVPAENMFQSKAATDGERFFVGGWDNHFRCIDAKTGNVVWDLPLGRKGPPGFSAYAPAITHPCVGDGKVFVSTNDGIFHAIDIATGAEVWRVDRKNMGYSSPSFHDGKVYFALSDKGDTYCANANTGEILWQRNVGSVIYDGGFAWGSGNVFVGCVNGTFNALDAVTGKIVYQYRLPPGHLLATPATDDARVYIGSMNGKVTALPVR